MSVWCSLLNAEPLLVTLHYPPKTSLADYLRRPKFRQLLIFFLYIGHRFSFKMIKFDWFTTPVTTLTSHGRVTHSTEERPRVLASHTLFRARAILHFYSVQLMLVCTHIDTKSVARKIPPPPFFLSLIHI